MTRLVTVEVRVSLKPKALDPEGETVKRALHRLGYEEVEDVRTAKVYRIELDIDDEEEAVELVDEMCRRLLANPVVEDYEIEVVE
ncbi:phosphoribosylformylglycinamidine synthase subunit PurS [Methanopyrus sp.]